ncbi:serine hydrolase domain-containing protein [Streptomyces mirabilis]|uniref:Serine hydrolase n=1 Tax=Streptomyces mirabilis TaxID=68239 RepID=A0ABU3V6L6_9ACTN|nr:serine hydrolase domain-containing protein [Streptomyces mirabilis]MDU9001824.1 serine hydrolase [Streptomyces mirabilis]
MNQVRRGSGRPWTALSAVAVSLLILGAAPAATGAPPAPHPVGASGTTLHALLDSVVAVGVPGVLERTQDGRRVISATAGVADLGTGAPLRPDARFRVGSITKTFIASVVLQLVGEHRLALDQPVARWLPGLLADGEHITVRELLNHTSGLYDYTDDPAVLAGLVNNRVWRPAQLVAIAESHPALFPPGSAWGYSNTNYIVAGLLIEAVTGHPLAQELQQRIFTPLGLTHTSFPSITGRITGYHAHGYLPAGLATTANGEPTDVTGLNPSSAWAAGAIVSSARDLSRFYLALMDGRLIGPRLLREMTTTVAEDPADPATYRYGLGIERVQDPCGTDWGLGGAIPGYQTMAYWNQSTGRTVVLASTMDPAPAAAQAPLANAASFALCGPTNGTQNDLPRHEGEPPY